MLVGDPGAVLPQASRLHCDWDARMPMPGTRAAPARDLDGSRASRCDLELVSGSTFEMVRR